MGVSGVSKKQSGQQRRYAVASRRSRVGGAALRRSAAIASRAGRRFDDLVKHMVVAETREDREARLRDMPSPVVQYLSTLTRCGMTIRLSQVNRCRHPTHVTATRKPVFANVEDVCLWKSRDGARCALVVVERKLKARSRRDHRANAEQFHEDLEAYLHQARMEVEAFVNQKIIGKSGVRIVDRRVQAVLNAAYYMVYITYDPSRTLTPRTRAETHAILVHYATGERKVVPECPVSGSGTPTRTRGLLDLDGVETSSAAGRAILDAVAGVPVTL